MLANDSTAVLAVLAIGCIWLAATAAERMELPAGVTIAGEAALIGMASALALTETYQVLTVLAFPPFTAALRRGAVGALASLVIELVGFGVTIVDGHRGHLHPGGDQPGDLDDLQPRAGADRHLHPRRPTASRPIRSTPTATPRR